jgi:hypothetical protein
MHHLEQYEIAELVASRAASNKGGYFTPGDDGQSPYAGETSRQPRNGTEKQGQSWASPNLGKWTFCRRGQLIPYDSDAPDAAIRGLHDGAKLGICAGSI